MKEWAIGLTLAMGLPFAFKWGKAYLSKLAADKMLEAIRIALEKGDDDDDVLIHAIVKWVERKTESLGAGDKPAQAATALCERFPLLKGKEADVTDLIRSVIIAVEKAAESDKP